MTELNGKKLKGNESFKELRKFANKAEQEVKEVKQVGL